MNILIIGGDSYVGRSFIKYSKSGAAIRAISRVKTDFENELVLSDLAMIPAEEFINADIIFNCAAIVHKKKAPENLYMEVNYKLVKKLATEARNYGVKKFIQMSTISVYGRCEEIHQETKENPIDPYGESKLLADRALVDMQNDDFKVMIIRSPMIYGPDALGNMNRLIQLVEKSLILPFKNIKNKRDFIFIENLVYIIEKALQVNLSGILIVSDGDSVSTEEIIRFIIKKSTKRRMIIPFPFLNILKRFKPMLCWKLFGDLKVDNSIVLKKLNIRLPYSFQGGMEKMVSNFLKK